MADQHAAAERKRAASAGQIAEALVVPVEVERRGVDDGGVAGGTAAAIAELQSSGADRGRNTVRCGEDRGAGADLQKYAGAGNVTAEGVGVGTIDRKGAIVGYAATDRTRSAAFAELQRAAVDRGTAGIAVAAGQHQRAIVAIVGLTVQDQLRTGCPDAA